MALCLKRGDRQWAARLCPSPPSFPAARLPQRQPHWAPEQDPGGQVLEHPSSCCRAREASTMLCPCQAAGAPGARCRAAACPCLTSSSTSSSSHPRLPEQWRVVTLCETPGPCWVLEEHQWGTSMGLPTLAAPDSPVGGSPVEFPGVSWRWKWLEESRFSFAPDLPADVMGAQIQPQAWLLPLAPSPHPCVPLAGAGCRHRAPTLPGRREPAPACCMRAGLFLAL